MPIYAVVDTNVIVSSLLTKNGNSPTVRIMDEILSGRIIPVYNTAILKEYNDVLSRPKFGFSTDQIDSLLFFIFHYGLLIDPMPTNVNLPDKKDIPFFEVVMEKKKEDNAYLVTGNIKHFPILPFIVTPSEMILILDAM